MTVKVDIYFIDVQSLPTSILRILLWISDKCNMR